MGNPRYANGHRRRQLRARILATETLCALCGEPVDKTLHYLDPGAPVIDEDLPIARGGDPLSRKNTAMLHRSCNSWKSTKTLAEARALWGQRPAVSPTPAALTTSRAW